MTKLFLAALMSLAACLAMAGDHGDIIVYQLDRSIIGKVVIKPVEVYGPLWGDIGHGTFAERRTAYHHPSSKSPEYQMEEKNTNPAFCKGLKFSITESGDQALSVMADYSKCRESIQDMLRKTQADDFIDGLAAAILYTNNKHKLRVSRIRLEVTGVRAKPVIKELEWESLRKRYRPLYKVVFER